MRAGGGTQQQAGEGDVEDQIGGCSYSPRSPSSRASRLPSATSTVTAWLMVNGYINAEPGYPQTTAVKNRFSEFTMDLYGADMGAHARTVIAIATVPVNLPVVISAEIEISTPNRDITLSRASA